jgi:hypothetical protein
MKQALEALEEAHYKMEHYQDEEKREKAITAIKQALAAPVQEPAAWAVHYNGPIPLFTKTKAEAEAWGGNYILPLYTTPPAPQPVPVQKPMHPEIKKMYEDYFDKFFRESSAAQPVPVKTYHDGKPWPVAPKPWVGLTDEEVNVFVWNMPYEPGQAEIRAIEAKLKEKNHG